MERLEHQLSSTYLPRVQSMLMMKCVAEQILLAGNMAGDVFDLSGKLLFGC